MREIIIINMKPENELSSKNDFNEKNAKPKKTHGKKYRVRVTCVFVFLAVLLNFITCTLFAGDRSVIDFIRAYDVSEIAPLRAGIEVAFNPTEDCYEITNSTGTPLKVMQLTDLHIGCGYMTLFTDKAVVEQVYKCVAVNSPDLIVVTGDAISPIYVRSGTWNNYNSLDAFIMLMEKTGIPWAFCFGNHDSEGLASKRYISDRLERAENCLFRSGKESVNGYGNYYIKVFGNVGTERTLETALFFTDTGAGNFFFGYDSVEQSQIDWYEGCVNALYSEKPDVKTLMFFHIPFYEYQLAWDAWKNGSDNVEKFFGVCDEKISYGKPTRFFEKIKELGSTKWLFCGHDHECNWSILLKDSGIRLTYGMSMDYSAYIVTKYLTKYRGATIIEISEGGVTVKQAPQDNGYAPV